jgi:hypothetical protein
MKARQKNHHREFHKVDDLIIDLEEKINFQQIVLLIVNDNFIEKI